MRFLTLLSLLGFVAAIVVACSEAGIGRLATAEVAPERAAVLPTQASDSYYTSAAKRVAQRATGRPAAAQNIILFVGDGMGVSTVTAGRIYAGQSRGLDGESYRLAMETLPHLALSKTYSHDAQVSDSASTATAMLAGVKARSRTLGLSQDAAYNNCASQDGTQVQSIFELAERAGLSTGVVSTARLTHATPASAYAHAANRNWEDNTEFEEEGDCPDIAAQLIDWPYGDGLEIAMGGGRRHFLPADKLDPEDEGATGRRTDGRNLAAEWAAKSDTHVVVYSGADLDAADIDSGARVLGLFERSHMEYELDRPADEAGEPSLAEMTQAAITRLSQSNIGYVLLVEGGRIDHAHHDTNAARALADVLAFDDAVAAALDMVDLDETLVIVTADHSHTLTISGYPARGNPILGKVAYGPGQTALAGDGRPYTTLGYSNGSSACVDETGSCGRADLTNVDTTAPDFKQQATVPLSSETHGGEDVPVFAAGPGSHLVSGVMEQHEIFHIMGRASGLVAEPVDAAD